MPVKIKSTGGGSVSLDVPSTGTDYTLTLPAKTGNIITSADANTVTQSMISQTGFYGGYGPAFHAYQSVAQTLATTTWTKIQLQTEEFDTANCFDSTLNYRFTPNVAGYYLFNMSVAVLSSQCAIGIQLYKNGVGVRYPIYIPTGNIQSASGGLIYANGSTDYFEMYAYFSTGQNSYASSGATWFDGYLARPA